MRETSNKEQESMLQDIIDELAKGTYSSDDEVALAELKASGEVLQGTAPAGLVLTYLAQIGKLQIVEDIANGVTLNYDGENHPLRDAAKAVVITYTGRTEFEFNKPEVQAMCQAFVLLKLDGTPSNGVDSGILTQVEKDGLEAIGQTPKFENATLKLVRQARGKTNVESVVNWTASKRKLKMTVVGSVFERLQPTITYADNDFTAAPIRRVVEVADESAGTYIVKLDNLRPNGIGTISVELGAPNIFTLELG